MTITVTATVIIIVIGIIIIQPNRRLCFAASWLPFSFSLSNYEQITNGQTT